MFLLRHEMKESLGGILHPSRASGNFYAGKHFFSDCHSSQEIITSTDTILTKLISHEARSLTVVTSLHN